MEVEVDKEILKTNITCLPNKRAEIDETAHLKKYIMWENKSNICWLDASMALIAHNKVMKRASQVSPNSGISKIIASYAEAISIINNLDKSSISWQEIVNLAKSKLSCVQESTLQYLQPILKYKPGDPDSAFCSLYNLLKEDSVIKGIFDVTWISIKTCTNCNKNAENTKTKPLITLSKVDSFDPKSPTVIYNCNCDKSQQKIKFVFVTLPPCLIFHFENGAGHEKPPLTFVTHERQYYLTGIMTLEKGQESNVNHFITWVRDPFVDKWLDCNDLNPDVVYFTPNFPDIRFEDVSFYVYESFDDLGTIRDYKKINIKNTEEDIVLIDISEESGSETSNASVADMNAEKPISSADSQVTIFSTKIDSSKSQKETLAVDEEHISDKNKIQVDSAQSSVVTSYNEIKDSENNKNANELIKEATPDQDTNGNIFFKKKLFQNEEKTIDGGLQDLRRSDDKSSKNTSKRVIQPDFSDKSSFEASELNVQFNSCSNQKQTNDEDTVSLYEEKKFENTVAIKKPKGIEVKEDKQYQALLHAKELHISDLRDKNPEDITKADIAKSGTSYVKVSFRKKKYPGLTFLKKNSVKNFDKPSSGETKIMKYPDLTFLKQNSVNNDNKISPDGTKPTSVRKSPRSVKETKHLKRNRDEEWDTTPFKRPRKNKNLKKTFEELQSDANREDRSHMVFNKDPRMSLQHKPKIKNIVGEKKIQQKHNISYLTLKDNKKTKEFKQVFANQQTYSRMFSATENLNENNNDEGKILKEFEDVWSSHASGCRCERASLEETIDTVVDYTFAYLCKLSKGLKKANTH